MIMILLNKPLLEDYNKAYPHLTTAINRFTTIVEQSIWATPQDIKDSFGRHADYVAPFWIIDIGGKAGARIILKVDHQKKVVRIERIWMDHRDYMLWSKSIRKRK